MRAKAAFFAVFVATISTALLANVLPYFRTRHAYQYDGQEVAGFPFLFHKVGGDCWPSACDTYGFHVGYFTADLTLALASAIAAGLIAARVVGRKSGRSQA